MNNVVQAVLWDESTVFMYITTAGSDGSSIVSISIMIWHGFVWWNGIFPIFHGDFHRQFDYYAMESRIFMAISSLLIVYLYCGSKKIEMTQFGLTIDEKLNQFQDMMRMVGFLIASTVLDCCTVNSIVL